MIPGEGRNPATKIQKDLQKKLESFGIRYKKNSINFTLDGCATNIKVARKMKKFLQLCLAHGVQLGVVKTVYIPSKKMKSSEIESDNNDEANSEASEKENDELEDEEIDELEDEDSDDIDASDDEDEIGLFKEEPNKVLELNENFEEAINKLRKIVKAFHGKSNVRGHQLQEAIKAWQKKTVS